MNYDYPHLIRMTFNSHPIYIKPKHFFNLKKKSNRVEAYHKTKKKKQIQTDHTKKKKNS